MAGRPGVGSTSPSNPFELGSTRYAARRSPLRMIELTSDLAAVRARLREECPHLPGIYAFFDADDRLIYVGMSIDLRKRLSCYFFDRTDDVKERRIAQSAVRVGWEPAIHPLTAALRELELIRRWRPRFNVKGQRDRFRTGYVYLTTEEAPRFRVEKAVPRACRRWWGPVLMNYRTFAAVERLNFTFQLRDCPQDVPMRFSDQPAIFQLPQVYGCLRGGTGTCAAPCSGSCSRADYLAQVTRGCDLLDGKGEQTLAQMEANMLAAAQQKRFEYAASLRDAWSDLSYLAEQVDTLQQLQRQYWFVYPVRSATGREYWYIVAGGVIVHIVRKPRTAKSLHDCLQRVDDTLQQVGRETRDEDLTQMFMLASWFRKYPEELARTVPLATAEQWCRDRLAGPSG
jgi:excinuclease ABC subunit C